MPKHTYDKKTAEFRTIRNLRGYNDDERGFPPSIVDESDYEDINVLVGRFMRGEKLPIGKAVHFDGDGPADEMLAAASPLQADGADLADVQPIVEGIKSRVKDNAKKAKGSPAPKQEAPPAQPTEAPNAPEKGA